EMRWPHNFPAPGKAGTALPFAIVRHRPGQPEWGRSASFQLLVSLTLFAAICLLNKTAFSAVPKDFVPDVIFTGSALSGWHPIGRGGGRADNGEIIGIPSQTSGGWLVLDKGYQDIQIYASFISTNGAKAGILLRTEKTANSGLKGVLVSLNEADTAAYDVE